jgi:rubrerythrin
MLLSRLRGALTDADTVFYYECRDCGTTLTGEDAPLNCSTCDSMNVARYHLG